MKFGEKKFLYIVEPFVDTANENAMGIWEGSIKSLKNTFTRISDRNFTLHSKQFEHAKKLEAN